MLQGSEYCLSCLTGGLHTLADPPDSGSAHNNPDSQSLSRLHNSPALRPYANKQVPTTEKQNSLKRGFQTQNLYLGAIGKLRVGRI